MFSTLDMDFVFKLILNTFSVSIIVFGCYLRGFLSGQSGNREHATSFLLFAVGVFSVTYLLHSVDISMGFAFGLFAVFSMLRYRTESISVREMTYLFLVIAMSLLSSVGSTNYVELVLLHSVFFSCALFCEAVLSRKTLLEKTIQYEKIENITPRRRQILIADLKARTGLDVDRVEISHIDFLKDSASLVVFYKPELAIEPEQVVLPDNTVSYVQAK